MHIHIAPGTLTTADSELAGRTSSESSSQAAYRQLCCCCRARALRMAAPALAVLGRAGQRPRSHPHALCPQRPEWRSLPPPISHPHTAVPNYWQDLRGTRSTPIVIEAADGKGTVVMDNMNLKDVR